ncbi:DUF4091 domain-containing protein [Puteibacter caeruleilacunae]|nr:DUF4091 domain-containing protein [Puteibacter caeruleilacunae]
MPRVETFQEAADPKKELSTEWDNLQNGLQVSFGSIDNRYRKHEIPVSQKKEQIALTAWRGERVAAQLVLWSKDSIDQVRCEASALKSADGVIDKGQVATSFVRYVLTDEFRGGCGHRKPEDFDVNLVADALDPVAAIDIEGKSVRPVWLSVKVPADTKPGNYEGTVTVSTPDQKSQQLSYTVKVIDRTLPAPKDWTFHLDLWQNPFAIARWHKVEPWSEQHFKVMAPYIKMLADAGQKCITTSINHHPWNSQTFDPFLSMIKWTQKKDGSWEYDYTNFDKWVRFARDLGITKQINCYSMVPWHNQFQYFKEGEDKPVDLKVKPETKEYNAFWKPFLTDFTKHLKGKGWFKYTTIAMDERQADDMKAVIKLIKSVDSDFKIALAANHWIPEIMNDIYDISLIERFDYPEKMKSDRKAKGQVTTFYTCCSCPYPNTFTFSPPAEATWFGWYASALGIDGYLRWAYNSWVEKPMVDSRFRAWPAGDTYIVYPGAISSIRFERMIEGIQDFEKIKIVKQDLEGAELEHFNEVLKKFAIDAIPEVTAAKMVNEAKELLNK